MRHREPGQVRRPRQIHRRALALARSSTPVVMAASALAAMMLLALGLAGCASQEIAVGNVRIEPGAEGVYVLGRGDASRACRDAAVRATSLGTRSTTARVARCNVVGASIVCAEEEISCLAAEKAEQ